MIVGTAGHIDHGKTTLVRALTGVDTDRLPEEKRRGISIELGYAYLDVPGAPPALRIGFVDVPGHERLVHTMISGATGIDLALLLVAADDGPMPQTREHLAVLSLLGLARAAVVITKTDRVDGSRLAAVRAAIAALLAPTPLRGAPVFALSAAYGAGVGALQGWLFEQARSFVARDHAGRAFRLAIDRAFTIDGVGTVVTGSVHAGRVLVGDDLALVPSAAPVHARVRSLHAQDRAVDAACAGQRCAIALHGIAKDAIARGQWLVANGAATVTDRLDAAITLWRDGCKALRSGTPVQLHLGAAQVEASVALLDPGDALTPGEHRRAQLVLRRPLGAWHGDRFVLRDAAGSRTVAGGTVIDPFGPVRYRRTPQRLAELDAWAIAAPVESLAALLAVSGHGLDLRRWQRARGCVEPPARLPADVLRVSDAADDLALADSFAEAHAQRFVDSLAAYHAAHPCELGPDAGRLQRLAAPRLAEPLRRALLARLIAQGRVVRHGAFVHLPEHGVRLSAADERIAQKVTTRLSAAAFEGAWVRDLARDTGEAEGTMRATLARLAQRGKLHQVVNDLYYPPSTMRRLAALARDLCAEHGGELTAARFRDASRLGRNRAIQVLEYFDRIGLLRRVGDAHRLRRDSELFRDNA